MKPAGNAPALANQTLGWVCKLWDLCAGLVDDPAKFSDRLDWIMHGAAVHEPMICLFGC